jgi:hypothetical protein
MTASKTIADETHKPRIRRSGVGAAAGGLLMTLAVLGCGRIGDEEGTADPAANASRRALQAQVADFAERERLTGLSPAFLQRVEVCHGLSPASVSGCTTSELDNALAPPGGADDAQDVPRPHTPIRW